MANRSFSFQGGKQHGGLLAKQEKSLDEINNAIVDDTRFKDIEDLREKLDNYKMQFMDIDRNNSGEIDTMNLKCFMENLGQAKTHLEIKKMIREVDTTNSGTITYYEFIDMMISKKNCVFKMILLFEEKMKEKEKPTGLPPKRSLDHLP